jgi:hypothetical protein
MVSMRHSAGTLQARRFCRLLEAHLQETLQLHRPRPKSLYRLGETSRQPGRRPLLLMAAPCGLRSRPANT